MIVLALEALCIFAAMTGVVFAAVSASTPKANHYTDLLNDGIKAVFSDNRN